MAPAFPTRLGRVGDVTVRQERLRRVAQSPERVWTNVIENVPRWPSPPRLPSLEELDCAEYAPCEGRAALIDAIRDRELAVHRHRLTHEQVLVTHGAMHAISLVTRMLARRGRTALVQAPAFTSVVDCMVASRMDVQFFGVARGMPDLDAVARELAHGDVALIYVNSPNNPTGQTISVKGMRALVDLSRTYEVALVADMVYDSYGPPSGVTSPIGLCNDDDDVFAIHSMSKCYGAPGLRVGWIASCVDSIEELSAMLERECVAVSGPSQSLATQLLRAGNEALVAHVTAGRTRVVNALRAINGASFEPPAGGTQVMVELDVDDVEEFGDLVLEHLGLVLATRSQYDGSGSEFIRFPVGLDPEVTERALALLQEGLQRFHNSSWRPKRRFSSVG